MTATTSKAGRRPRARKVESFADWMARIDAEVEEQARRMERKPPTYADLRPGQKRLVEMLIEHLRLLTELRADEELCARPEYYCVSRVVSALFAARYPEWARWVSSAPGSTNVKFPRDVAKDVESMVRNCGPSNVGASTRARAEEEED